MQQPRWITFIYRQGGSGRGGGGGQGQFDFFCHGGLWGFQNKLEQKSRGQGNFFFYNFHRDYFFSNGRVRQEGG